MNIISEPVKYIWYLGQYNKFDKYVFKVKDTFKTKSDAEKIATADDEIIQGEKLIELGVTIDINIENESKSCKSK